MIIIKNSSFGSSENILLIKQPSMTKIVSVVAGHEEIIHKGENYSEEDFKQIINSLDKPSAFSGREIVNCPICKYQHLTKNLTNNIQSFVCSDKQTYLLIDGKEVVKL